MKIRGMHVTGFGHFAGRSFMPLSPAVNVFFGENEAGKSTLLAFVRTMLYGFPRQRRDQHYPPLAGGAHGGRLWLVDGEGRHYNLERKLGRRGPELTVRLPDGTESSAESALSELRGGASAEVFNRVFAFGLGELQAIDSLAADEVSAQIYSAGIGAGAVPAALARLKQREDEIFRRGGQKQRVAVVLRDLDSLEDRLRQRRGDDAAYARLQQDRQKLEERLAGSMATTNRLQADVLRLERIVAARTPWARRERLRAEIDPAIPDVPPETGARLEQRVAAVEETESALVRARTRLVAAEETVRTIHVDEAVVAAATAIDGLARGLDAFEASCRDLPKREAELSAARRSLAAALDEMGSGFDLEAALRLEGGAAGMEALREIQGRLEEAARKVESAATRQAVDEEQLARAKAEAAALEANLADGPERLDIERRAALLDECRAAVEAATMHRVGRGNGAGGWGTGLVALLAGGLAGSWAYVAAGSATAAVLAGLATALVAAVASHFVRGRSGRRNVAERRLQDVLAAAEIDEAELPAALRELAADRAKVEQSERLTRDWEAACRSMDLAAAACDRSGGRLETARREREDVAGEWDRACSDAGLPGPVAPGVALALLNQARLVAERARSVGEAEHRAGAIQRDIDRYLDVLSGALAQAGEEPAIEIAGAVAVASSLIERLAGARRAADRMAEAVRARDEATALVEDLDGRLAQQKEELARLLASFGCHGVAELRSLCVAAERQAEIRRELRETEVRLAEISGTGESIDSFCRAVAKALEGDAEQALAEARAALAEATSERERLLSERGTVDAELRRLRQGDETSALLAQREVSRAGLVAAARDWAEARVARHLIEEARARYEAEQQPGVIRAAEEYFRAMTGGRYTRVIAPLGEQSVRVGTADGPTLSPDQLSRGTREQLYLALRFGLIEQFARRGTALPVVIDEILVNFDPARARAAAAAFAKLAERHQVIVFTCHPWVRDLFQEASPGAMLWDLGTPSAAEPERAMLPGRAPGSEGG